MKPIRNEEYSVYYYLQSALSGLGYTINLVRAFPYHEVTNDTLVLPTIAVEHVSTLESGGELGSRPWRQRTWQMTIFAETASQRDELAETLWDALELAIPIKDYSIGFPPAEIAQPILMYADVADKSWNPIFDFQEFNKLVFWRAVFSFDTISTLT